MAFEPTDLQGTRLRQAIVETTRYPGWSVIRQFIVAEVSKGAEADIPGLTKFIVSLFEEALAQEAEHAAGRTKTQLYQASD